jgi:hypothetical protein
LARCQGRDEVSDLNTEDVIMCCLVRAIRHGAVIVEYGQWGEMVINRGKLKKLGEKSAQLPLCPPC